MFFVLKKIYLYIKLLIIKWLARLKKRKKHLNIEGLVLMERFGITIRKKRNLVPDKNLALKRRKKLHGLGVYFHHGISK